MLYISFPFSFKDSNKSMWDRAITQVYQRIPDTLQGEEQDACPQRSQRSGCIPSTGRLHWLGTECLPWVTGKYNRYYNDKWVSSFSEITPFHAKEKISSVSVWLIKRELKNTPAVMKLALKLSKWILMFQSSVSPQTSLLYRILTGQEFPSS